MSTVTTKPNKIDHEAIADQAVIEQQEIFESAESILWNLDPESRPDSRQLAVLRRAGIVDTVQLEGERGRVAHVKELLALAGSPAEFKQASSAAIAAAKAYQEKAPALEQQLAKIQSQLADLERERDRTGKALSNYTSVRTRLRGLNMLPRFVVEAYETDVAALRCSALGRRIGELEATIGVIDSLQLIPPGSQSAMLHCETAMPELITMRHAKTPGSQGGPVSLVFDETGFVAYRQRRLKVEKPQLERELAKLKDEYQHELSRISLQLEYYVDRIESALLGAEPVRV